MCELEQLRLLFLIYEVSLFPVESQFHKQVRTNFHRLLGEKSVGLEPFMLLNIGGFIKD